MQAPNRRGRTVLRRDPTRPDDTILAIAYPGHLPNTLGQHTASNFDRILTTLYLACCNPLSLC